MNGEPGLEAMVAAMVPVPSVAPGVDSCTNGPGRETGALQRLPSFSITSSQRPSEENAAWS